MNNSTAYIFIQSLGYKTSLYFKDLIVDPVGFEPTTSCL